MMLTGRSAPQRHYRGRHCSGPHAQVCGINNHLHSFRSKRPNKNTDKKNIFMTARTTKNPHKGLTIKLCNHRQTTLRMPERVTSRYFETDVTADSTDRGKCSIKTSNRDVSFRKFILRTAR